MRRQKKQMMEWKIIVLVRWEYLRNAGSCRRSLLGIWQGSASAHPATLPRSGVEFDGFQASVAITPDAGAGPIVFEIRF
jgi:hypothetical protein